MQFVGLNAV